MKTRLTRRNLLKIGATSFAAHASAGVSLPQLLAADQANSNSSTSTGASFPSAKSCIFIHQYGGLSQLDSWDMKPHAPAEIRGPYFQTSTATPGFKICELMPKLARLSQKYSVIRSLTHKNAQHDQANSMLLAGKTTPRKDDPSFGAMVTRLSPAQAAVPPHIWLQKYGGGAMPPEYTYLTGGNLGAGYAPMLIGKRHDENPAQANFRVRAFDSDKSVTRERLTQRRELSLQLRGLSDLGQTPEFASEALFHEKSFDLIHSEAARAAFQVEKEKRTTRERYGMNPMGQNLLLARRLIEAGVRLVNVVAWAGLAAGEKFVSVETWDMHGNADVGIFENGWNGLPYALPVADQSVAALIEDLDERGLLESTLIVFVGEFGRTPKIRKGAKRIGRDHWPNCYSGMVAGGGIQPGVVYGESDRQGGYVQSNPVTLEDFTATLFSAMDIPPQSRLSPDGFTQPASSGQPIQALLR